MDPRYHTTLASLGQRYQDYPSDLQQNRPPQDIIRELFQAEMLRQQMEQPQIPPGPPGTSINTPGQYFFDPLGHRGAPTNIGPWFIQRRI